MSQITICKDHKEADVMIAGLKTTDLKMKGIV